MIGPNSVPMPPMIGAEDELDRARDVEDLLGKQIVVVEGEEHAGDRGHAGGENDGDHLVAESVDAERAGGLLVLADGLPEIADAALEQEMAEHQRGERERQQHVVEHDRPAAQIPKIVGGVVGDRQEEAGGTADPVEMIETDAGEFGEGDGEDREIDAGDAEAERQEPDEGADQRGDQRRRPASRARDATPKCT